MAVNATLRETIVFAKTLTVGVVCPTGGGGGTAPPTSGQIWPRGAPPRSN